MLKTADSVGRTLEIVIKAECAKFQSLKPSEKPSTSGRSFKGFRKGLQQTKL